MTASQDRPWSRRVAPDDEDAGGGRATPLSPGGQSEPLHYQTVQRPPGSEGQFRPRRSAPERRDEPDLPPTEALPTQDVPRYRPRDFSPEGRRAVPSWAPTAGQTDVPLSERLDYHTLTRAEVRAAAQRFGAGSGSAPGDATAGEGSPSAAPGASAGFPGGSGPAGDGSPMSTPEQPLTRRQLRALREAQEAERGESAPTDAAPTESSEQTEEERPSARPWAPVFYGEPVRSEDPADADSSEVAAESDDSDSPEAPSWSGSAPATFAIPVIADAPAADDLPDGAGSGSESEAGADQQRSLDDWVAGLYREQPPADESPLELVEPPEPARWGSDAPRSETAAAEPQADAPSVLDDLFSPPTAAPDASPGIDAETPQTSAGRPVTDPLEFLDAAPSAADRVDLPAPSAWEAPPVVGQPPVEPPGTRAEEPAIPVEAEEVSPADAGEIHPVVIDAEPLPAEPITPSAPDAVSPSPGPTPVPSGHWSAQAADDTQADVASGRDVGGGHGVVTTNALVLPSIPSPELSGPLTTTGEIVITGSIEMPRSLSSTGAHPTQLDQSSLDHELDPGDQQIVSVDSQPVRAIKAVSTHTSTRGMMTSTKPHGNRGLTVLIIVTAGLAIVTLGVLAIGLINNAF